MRTSLASARVLGRTVAAVGGLLFALPTADASAQAPDGLGLLEAVGERYAGVEVLCADFQQRLEVPLLGDEATGAGRLCQARPNLFAMRFSDPEGDAVIADGEAVWVYLPSSQPGQVLKTSPDQTAGGHDFHREFLEDTSTKYDVEYEGAEALESATVHRLRLTPKGAVGYAAAVLWIDGDALVLRRVRVEEENGTVRTVTLSNVELDAEPGAAWFTFVPPPGASVLIG